RSGINVIDDTVSTPWNTAIEIDILDNDHGVPANGTIKFTNPGHGTVVRNDNGTPDDLTDDTVTYTPTSGFNGTDSFKYTVCDTHGNSSTATVTVRVGTCPVVDVVDDYVSTPKDTPVEVDILDNDSGIPSDGSLTVTQPDNGTVTINDNGTPDDITDDTVIYTPDTDFVG